MTNKKLPEQGSGFMSVKLFYEDSYLCSAVCEVEDIITREGKTELVLKSTPFYPEGGGQPCDLGMIDGVEVEYVYEKEAENHTEVIYHVLKEKPENMSIKIGSMVECKVDFERRFDLTQQHSGEHLLSGAFYKLFRAVNAGFHMGEDYLTIDMDCKDLSAEMIKRAEAEANIYIYENKPIITYFVTKEEALKLPLRKELKAEGRIRIVEMAGGVECSACCGTHVKNTGEIGLIKVLKHESYKGKTRIYFKCGQRALNDYISKHDSVMELSRIFSAEASEVVVKVKNQFEQISELKLKLTRIINKIAISEAEALISRNANNLIAQEYVDEEFEFLERVYDQLKEQNRIIILTSLKNNRMLYANHANDGKDCGKVFKETLQQYGGRGGGNFKRAQASFENIEDMRKYTKYLITIHS